MQNVLGDTSGLTIIVGDPAYWSPRRPALFNLTSRINSYSHTNSAWLGFDKANLSIALQDHEIQDWLDNGLGRDVSVHAYDGSVTWEGFVNQVDITVGDTTIKRGPLLDIGNRCSAVYSLLDYGTTPPTSGAKTSTTIQEDLESQAKYGIIEKVLSLGDMTTAEAEQNLAMFLKENAWPVTSHNITLGGGSGPKLTLSLLGYAYWLDTFFYANAVNLSVTITDYIKLVLAGDVNNIFSTNYGDIGYNPYLINKYADDQPTALTAIKRAVELGDINDNRWLFQVGPGRKIKYYAAPTTIAYYRSIWQNRIETTGFANVDNWAVESGKWLFTKDFAPGQPPNQTPLRKDPRYFFIEAVNFSLPNSVSLDGGMQSQLSSRLAKLSMKGIA